MNKQADSGLLARFVTGQDEEAFGELLSRHGMLVRGTCWRVLQNERDAEEACQATFVALALQAAKIARVTNLAGWLHRVAHHVSAEIVRKRENRLRRESEYMNTAAIQAEEPDEESRAALLNAVELELAGLPESCRDAIILRYLEGHSQEDAAQLAGCAVGTFSSRAARGIERLRQKLAQRGFALNSVAVAGLLAAQAQQSLPEALLPAIIATVKSALTTGATGSAVALAKNAIRAMFWSKAAVMGKLAAGVVVCVAVPAVVATLTMSGPTHKKDVAVLSAVSANAEPQSVTIYDDRFDGVKLADFWETAKPAAQVQVNPPDHKSALVLTVAGKDANKVTGEHLTNEVVLISRALPLQQDVLVILVTSQAPIVAAINLSHGGESQQVVDLLDEASEKPIMIHRIVDEEIGAKNLRKGAKIKGTERFELKKTDPLYYEWFFCVYPSGKECVIVDRSTAWCRMDNPRTSCKLQLRAFTGESTHRATWPVKRVMVRRLKSLPEENVGPLLKEMLVE